MMMLGDQLTRRQMVSTAAVLGAAGIAGCTDLLPDDEDTPTPEPTQAVMFEIPQYLAADGTPEYSDAGLRFHDYINVAHGLSIPATAMRTSEYGHENFDPDLFAVTKPRLGGLWVDFLMSDVAGAFMRAADGRIWPYLEDREEGWVRSGEPDLETIQHASYVYHMHHRSGRFDQLLEAYDGLFRDITFEPPDFQTGVGRFVLDERRGGGSFYHDDDLTEFDNHSQAYGMAASHAHWYAWVRRLKPDGEGDMWRVPLDTLIDFLGYDNDVLANDVSAAIAGVLDDAWNESTGIWEFNGSTYNIDAVGALLRGVKTTYDALYEWGDDPDTATQLVGQLRTVLEDINDSGIVQPWGLPSEVEFTTGGVEAASDTVRSWRTWDFVNHLTGGYGVTRDRFTDLLETEQPEGFEFIGEITDEVLLGVVDGHGLDGGELVAEMDYGTGSVTDDRREAAAVGMFAAAATNAYGAGAAFERPDGWDDAPSDVVTNSNALFTTVIDHVELIEDEFLIEA